MRVDQDQGSGPRVRASISSVLIGTGALPLSRAKGLPALPPRAFRPRVAARRTTTSPPSVSWNATVDPGRIPRWSRNLFGIVTCPFVVTVPVIWYYLLRK
jgi:hypothetical protein